MKNPHVWLARVGAFAFLIALFLPASAISGGGRGFWFFAGAAFCLLYAVKEWSLHRRAADPS